MSGSSDDLTRAYLDRYCIEWRFLDTREATTECTLFGAKLDTPILLGGMAHYDSLQSGGAPLYAQAAKQTNTAVWTGFCSEAELEQVIAVGAPAARIVKPFAERDIVLAAMEHDEKAGACAIAMDVDHVYNKQGRCGAFGEHALASPSRSTLEEFAKHSGIPFFVKGIVSVRDAVMCAEAGVAGVVLSHHKDMFPWTVPPLKVLPEIRKAVGDRLIILVDSGLISGYDVFKALAWGADGVFTVRPMVPLFRDGGAGAVTDQLRKLSDELRVCLSRTGAPDIYHIDPSVVREL